MDCKTSTSSSSLSSAACSHGVATRPREQPDRRRRRPLPRRNTQARPRRALRQKRGRARGGQARRRPRPRLAHADSYDPERGKLSTWLYRIAKNESFRHKKGVVEESSTYWGDPDEALQVASAAPSPAAILARKEMLRFVDQRLRSMDERLRDVLYAHVFDGLSEVEIAEALGIPEGTARSRLFRACTQARELLRGYEGELRPFMAAILAGSEARPAGWERRAAEVLVCTAGLAGVAYGLMQPPEVLRTAQYSSRAVQVNVNAEAVAPELSPAPASASPCSCVDALDTSRPRALVAEIERAAAHGDQEAARAALVRYLRMYPRDPLHARALFGHLLQP
ncbi:sigma-70 family RNA polymerase sigma factor [Polyangium jinanense]|uniref:RNA polymerase sigma factor n=1 Tax=Polyangium jinanense TaxID=2829994 RepID=UPI0023402BD0|nr:sigma-70 family RNA polymerase sigma factor [Polyangium jinanense]MDC3952608.1 sigma-70 family RNA polymerase sigma factor [Polyangium jinanense]